MFSIKPLPEFTAWLDGLKDGVTRIRLARRLDKAQGGNFGDEKPVGEGVSRCTRISAQAGGCITSNAVRC